MANIYSMDSVYDQSIKVTRNALCRAIISDALSELNPNVLEDKVFEDREIKRVREHIFKNEAHSICGILREKLGIDIEQYKKKGSEDAFRVLQLLYTLYVSNEKTHQSKNDRSILKLLASPSMEHTDSDNAKYAEQFQDILAEIRKGVSNPEESEKDIRRIHEQWLSVHDLAGNTVGMEGPAAGCILATASVYLSKLLERLTNLSKEAVQESPKETIIESFYHLMLSARYLAENESLAKMRYADDLAVEPEIKELLLSHLFNKVVSWEEFQTLIDQKDPDLSNNTVKAVRAYLQLDTADDREYRFAVKYTQTVTSFWQLHRNGNPETASLTAWVIVMKELMRIRRQQPKYDNRYIGYTNAPIRLSAAIKGLNAAPPLAQSILLSRLNNCWYSMIGTQEGLQAKEQLDQILYEIEKIVFSSHQLQRIKDIHSFCFFHAVSILMSYDERQRILQFLLTEINTHLSASKLMISSISIPNKSNYEWLFPAALFADQCYHFNKGPVYCDARSEFYMSFRKHQMDLEAVIKEPNIMSNRAAAIESECKKAFNLTTLDKIWKAMSNVTCAYRTVAKLIADEIIRLHSIAENHTTPQIQSQPINFDVSFCEDMRYNITIDFLWDSLNGTMEIDIIPAK